MLIRFAVSNFLSFKERTEINFLAGEVLEHSNHVLISETDLELTHFAVLYGEKGSGKFNLLKALNTFYQWIVFAQPTEDSCSFRSSKESYFKPSTFEMECYLNGKKYLYGFRWTSNLVTEEWLYETTIEKTLIFEKKVKDDNYTWRWLNDYEQTDYFKLNEEKINDRNPLFLTTNQLLLSMYHSNYYFKHLLDYYALMPIFNTVFNYISSWKIILTSIDFCNTIDIHDQSFSDWLSHLLSPVNINRVDLIKSNSAEILGTDWQGSFLNSYHEIKNKLGDFFLLPHHRYLPYSTEYEAYPIRKLVAIHQLPDGTDYTLDLADEPENIQNLIKVALYLFTLFQTPHFLVINRIDDDLSPSLIRHLIHSISGSNIKGQLLFTINTPNHLDEHFFHPNEIWFAYRNEDHATEISHLKK